MSTELFVEIPPGVFRSGDVRAVSDQAAKWNRKFVLKFSTPFEQYIGPSEQLPEQVVVESGIAAHDVYT